MDYLLSLIDEKKIDLISSDQKIISVNNYFLNQKIIVLFNEELSVSDSVNFFKKLRSFKTLKEIINPCKFLIRFFVSIKIPFIFINYLEDLYLKEENIFDYKIKKFTKFLINSLPNHLIINIKKTN
tara:strand:- start:579 stop:956 length:378 start_codon:yes stop_codon:yes gene_type:complete